MAGFKSKRAISDSRDPMPDLDWSKMKVRFAPGAFDSWEGSQEELDALVAEIEMRVADGSLFADSVELDEGPEVLPPNTRN